MRLRDSRVLITGASSGIGAATARAMAGAGARLVLAGRDRRRLDAVAAETRGHPVTADLATGAAELAAVAEPVDVLVGNAGVGWAGPLTRMPDEAIERLIAVNLTAHILLTRLLLPGMVARGRGHIVFVASIAGAVGVREEAVYSATKAGLIVFAEGLRHELSEIGVSVVLPGVVDTPFFDRRGAPYARRRPEPIPAERVARAIVSAVERDLAESYVPGWLRLPARLRGAAPEVFRILVRRLG
ncbi:SDR family NAD(P)-dependent oxidoreductase [Actinomadura sp. HBU206391]|uniref:SDR family NAD(P)-dependent oxidoreductase n=1 Tax=Actinomadura sp. HBU206391 TaxID=2731692 RepID=UPI00164FF2FA|nr:SDR family NAD(P)-dependent oxidoreductase [Actinomadura sp. HBU206391]MBC6462774.1 SDR family NAD(P)-dependent oxidoreductase [Actinomadura sp. HBU206391]